MEKKIAELVIDFEPKPETDYFALENALQNLPGIERYGIHSDRKVIEIDFDPEENTIEGITEALKPLLN